MFVFNLIKKIIVSWILSQSKHSVSISIAIAFVFSLIPINIFAYLLLILFLLLNSGSLVILVLLSSGLKFITAGLYPVFHQIGDFFLSSNLLFPIFKGVEKIPVLSLLNWNNTIYFGSYMVSAVMVYPLFKLSKYLVDVSGGYIKSNKKYSLIYKELIEKKVGDSLDK